jgi:hypothetical protein
MLMPKSSNKEKRLAIAVVVAATMVYSFPGFAKTDCPSFPKVAFWGWVGYLNQLQNKQAKLSGIYERKSGVVIKRNDRKIRLSGDQLAKYLKVSKRRISVVQCLAEMEEANSLDSFSTAAGNPEKFASSSPPKPKASKKEAMSRTFIKIPNKLLAKLRKMAVRKSLKETRKVSVSEVVVEILKNDLRKKRKR